ncbi:hypothetical protein UA08_06816 [Talaromyces atroroseus]|uniref:CWH43-like N-terminal domain-containing protein n=1 Tax=Talaromyces atroroseus TaxID=1441469 RepID=A0A225AR37_TALAT|nr:hypothetical protein UA08_06816 [Talaromyces atroroseus]OKL58049.1 hypothetical protein UA08_06816 [Talaromyces atroroseus]
MPQPIHHLRRWAVILPTITVASWLAMLGALFGTWYTSGEPRYVSEEETQSIAFISDIGAQNLKPVFIVCSAVSMSTYIPSLVIYFFYVSPVRTSPWTSQGLNRGNSSPSIYSTNPVMSLPPRPLQQHSLLLHIGIPLLSILFTVIGATNLILLTIFDTARYGKAHQLLLPTSIAAHIISCLILCGWSMVCLRQYRAQQQSQYGGIYSGDKFTLELYAPRIPISSASLVVKTVVVVFEIGLVILFAIMTWWLKTFDMAAVIGWVIVLLFAGYMLCLIVDLWVLGTAAKSELDAMESKTIAHV